MTALSSSSPRWIALGAGHADRYGLGPKARWLDVARGRGLSVPRGVVVLDETWRLASSHGLVEHVDGTVRCPSPPALAAWLGLPSFRGRVAVRSAFAAEDGAAESHAGRFTSRLRVEAEDPTALAEALCAVWSSAARLEPAPARDVLILEMVEATHAGVAFTERDYQDDRVNYTTGTAEALVAGADAGHALTVPALAPWETDAWQPPGAPFAPRLQHLLRDVRQLVGPGDWDVEWADDGTRCWLLQVRRVTRPVRRNEAFTLANHKEILPELPSRFMTSLITSCAADLFGYYRAFDPSLPRRRLFIETFYGRPLINLSLLTDMMRHWGLPTRLVTDSIGGGTDQAFGFNLGRLRRKVPVLVRLGLAQLTSVASAERAIQQIHVQTLAPGPTLSALLGAMQRVYTALVREMFSLTQAMSGPLAVLRRTGTLAEHNARHRTIATQLYADLDALRTYVAAHPSLRPALQRGEVPADPGFAARWRAFLAVHGHRGVYESDVAQPRFHEAPAPLLQSLAAPPRTLPGRPRTATGWATRPLWAQAARAMRARERLRYEAMRAFDRLRQALLHEADRWVAAGVLPDREALWLLEVDEMQRLEAGWRPPDGFFAARAAEQEHLRTYDLPDLLYRFDDLDAQPNLESGAPSDRLHGLSLTPGVLRGRAWVAAAPTATLPDGFDPATTILVARAIDAGWVPTFALVAGVVVETGGDLSHGSIILREIGLPAVTNVQGATRHLATGQPVQLDAGRGVVRLDGAAGGTQDAANRS